MQTLVHAALISPYLYGEILYILCCNAHDVNMLYSLCGACMHSTCNIFGVLPLAWEMIRMPCVHHPRTLRSSERCVRAAEPSFWLRHKDYCTYYLNVFPFITLYRWCVNGWWPAGNAGSYRRLWLLATVRRQCLYSKR